MSDNIFFAVAAYWMRGHSKMVQTAIMLGSWGIAIGYWAFIILRMPAFMLFGIIFTGVAIGCTREFKMKSKSKKSN